MRMSSTASIAAWPMWSVPVTLGGCNTIEYGSASGLVTPFCTHTSGLAYSLFSQSSRILGSCPAGSYGLRKISGAFEGSIQATLARKEAIFRAVLRAICKLLRDHPL